MLVEVVVVSTAEAGGRPYRTRNIYRTLEFLESRAVLKLHRYKRYQIDDNPYSVCKINQSYDMSSPVNSDVWVMVLVSRTLDIT